eukprot:3836922-Pyramimonas_sp.AAC.1
MDSKTVLEHPKMAPSLPREALKPASDGVRRARMPSRRPKMARRCQRQPKRPPKRSLRDL